MNKSMFINYRHLFNLKKTWKIFYNDWYKVLYINIEVIFKKK